MASKQLKKQDGYGRDNAPLGGYALLTFVFLAILIFVFYLAIRQGIDLSDRFTVFNMFLLAIATHKLAWLITKDAVLSFVRAPFAKFTGWAAPGAAMHESGRGKGLQLALGEFLTCPWCVGQWVAAAFVLGFLFFPGITQVIAMIFAVLMMSDFLHILFMKAGMWMNK